MHWRTFRAMTTGLTPQGAYAAFQELEEWEQQRLIADRAADGTDNVRTTEVETYPAGTRILDEPAVDAIWGQGSHVLWSAGEALWICGDGGLGKSTLAQQLALARAGIGPSEFLEYPVKVDAGRVLYIAADRPRQLYRSIKRMISAEQVPDLDQTLLFAEDVPIPLSADASALTEWVEGMEEVGTVVIDSLKDVASDLGKDGEGNTVNLCLKQLVHSGREVVVLHHDRKPPDGIERTPRQRDIYGSRWLAAGAGSIFCLTGDPGTARVKAAHIKSPMTSLGTLDLWHNFAKGRTTIDRDVYQG